MIMEMGTIMMMDRECRCRCMLMEKGTMRMMLDAAVVADDAGGWEGMGMTMTMITVTWRNRR